MKKPSKSAKTNLETQLKNDLIKNCPFTLTKFLQLILRRVPGKKKSGKRGQRLSGR